MEFDTKAFMTEPENNEVKGFAIIQVNEDTEQYRVAEKWEPKHSEDRWLTYWISERKLLERIEEGSVKYYKDLTDSQYEGILKLASVKGASEVSVKA